MERNNKFPLFNKVINREIKYQSFSSGMNANKVSLYDVGALKIFFDEYHYRNGGIIHFRKKQ